MRLTGIVLTLLMAADVSAQCGDPERSVTARYRAGIDAFNAHNLDEFMGQFSPAIEMYTPTGWLRGAGQVRERFADTFARFPKVKMTIEDLRARAVSPEAAIVEFSWTVQPAGSGPAFKGVGSGVYVCSNGTWKEELEHETVKFTDDALKNPPGRK